MARVSRHTWAEIRNDADEVIGYRCADAGCCAREGADARAKREAAEREAASAAERWKQEDARNRARIEAKRAARREVIPWCCDGCGVELRLPRYRAERRAYCCGACRCRCRTVGKTAPCAACAGPATTG